MGGTDEGDGEAGGGGGAPWDRVLDVVDRWQRRHPPAAFLVGVMKKFGDDRAGQLAALVAYYGFFSLFPLLLVLVTVLGALVHADPDLQRRIVDSALAQFPVLGDDIRENVGNVRGSGVALAAGIVGALWAGLGAMQAAQTAMNELWDVPMRRRPNFLVTRLRSLVMLVVLGGAAVATTVVGAAGATLEGLGPVARVGALGLTTVLNVGIFLVAFRVLTDRPLGWRQLLPGAVVAGVAWAVLQGVGGYYVTRTVRDAGDTYGIFAVVIGLLSWLYLQAQMTILAAEVNVVRDKGLWPRSLTGRDLTPADAVALRDLALVEERRDEEEITVTLDGEVLARPDDESRPDEDVPAGDDIPGPEPAPQR
jgi:YihY family inner membrane protein